MRRLLFVTPRRAAGAVGGREQLSSLHEKCLVELLGDRLSVVRLNATPVSGLRRAAAALGGRIDGIDAASEAEIVSLLGEGVPDQLWLDGSNLGCLAKTVRRARPAVGITTFCHNVEARFFLGALRHRPSPRAAAVLLANFRAEAMAVRHSDRLVTLSDRDSGLFSRLYRRSATDLLPMAIEDRRSGDNRGPSNAAGLLFVGGAFYANLAGMRWFASRVAPHAALPTTVVGKGFDAYRDELEAAGRVKVIGPAADLAPHYREAAAVIAPIFDGSGMKTKVAEALMHGKPVIGTSEAFSGYEAVADRAGMRADTPAEWHAAIAQVARGSRPSFDPQLRKLYDEHHSYPALRDRIASLIARM